MTIKIRKLNASHANFQMQLLAMLAFDAIEDDAIDQAAAQILADVKARGDLAVLAYTNQFDRLEAENVMALEIGQDEWRAALMALAPVRRAAIQVAADQVRVIMNVRSKNAARMASVIPRPMVRVLGQKVIPLDRVGICVPGGKAAYPSSVLMNAIPAKVAGVQEIIIIVPTPDGVKNSLVLAAAAIAGVNQIFTIGGVQAVGALAYGTATIPQLSSREMPTSPLLNAACLELSALI